MPDVSAYLTAGAALGVFALGAWIVSIIRKDVSIVDSLWSLMFLIALLTYLGTAESTGDRAAILVVLVAVWATRLSAHIAWRNHGQPEDRRYQEIRRNNEPNFALKSLFIVFGLQAALAWFIALPLIVAASGQSALNAFDYAGIVLWLAGFAFEAIADWQLTRFKADANNAGKVLDQGLWAFTRHPNYFGEFVLWWGYFLIALGAGGWWTIVAPLLLSFLLLRVSGVALLERDIATRRPEYDRYIRSTNAFFPGPRKRLHGVETLS
jgi:steroid 5-alpha reductase family enzyme